MTGLPISRSLQVILTTTVAVVTAISALADTPNWLGSWGETGAALESSTRLSYPLVGALTAWVSSAPKRERFAFWISVASRPRLYLLLRLGGRCALLSFAGFSLAAIGLFVATAMHGDFGTLPVLSVLTVFCGFVASVGLGVAIGQWLPGYVAPAVALSLIFVWSYLANGLTPSLEPLEGFAVASDRERTFFETMPWVLVVRSVFLMALGVAVVSLAARNSTWWLGSLTAVCLGATPLVLTGSSSVQVVPAALKEKCEVSGTVRVCLTAARWHEVQDVMDAGKPLLTQLSGLNLGRVTLREESLPGAQETEVRSDEVIVPIGVVNGFNGNAHQVNPTDLQILISNRIFRERCTPQDAPNGENGPVATATDVVEAWALQSIGVAVDGSGGFNAPVLTDESLDWRKIAPFRSAWKKASLAVKTRWLSEHRSDMFACSTPTADLKL